MLKKIIAALIISASIYTVAFAEEINALPEIEGWICGELQKTQLDTISGNKGAWFERDYRTPSGVPFHAVLMNGISVKSWQFNSKTAPESIISTGESAEPVIIEGSKAMLENHPVLGFCLHIKIAPDKILTIETNGNTDIEKDDIISAACELIKNINYLEKSDK